MDHNNKDRVVLLGQDKTLFQAGILAGNSGVDTGMGQVLVETYSSETHIAHFLDKLEVHKKTEAVHRKFQADFVRMLVGLKDNGLELLGQSDQTMSL